MLEEKTDSQKLRRDEIFQKAPSGLQFALGMSLPWVLVVSSGLRGVSGLGSSEGFVHLAPQVFFFFFLNSNFWFFETVSL